MRKAGNRMRKYYRLTESGKTEVTEQVSAMHDFITSMHLIINPKLA